MALVAAGTLAMVIAVINYWAINQSLIAMEDVLLILIGFVTLLFMLRVI